MFILSNVGAFSVMKVELSNQLLAFTHEQNCWTTKLSVYHNGKMVDISSAAHGKLSTTPVGLGAILQYVAKFQMSPNDSKDYTIVTMGDGSKASEPS